MKGYSTHWPQVSGVQYGVMKLKGIYIYACVMMPNFEWCSALNRDYVHSLTYADENYRRVCINVQAFSYLYESISQLTDC